MFNAVDNIMRYLDIDISRHLRMDRCHTSARPVVVDNQIMGSYNSVIGSNLFHDPCIQIRIRALPDQRFQCIFCNGNTGPHSTATTSPAIASILTERKWQINVEAIVALVVITSPMESADVASITFD